MSVALAQPALIARRCEEVEQYASSLNLAIESTFGGALAYWRAVRRVKRDSKQIESRLEVLMDLIEEFQFERLNDEDLEPVCESLENVCSAVEDALDSLDDCGLYPKLLLRRSFRRISVACESIEDSVEAQMLSRNPEFKRLIEQRIQEVDYQYREKKNRIRYEHGA